MNDSYYNVVYIGRENSDSLQHYLITLSNKRDTHDVEKKKRRR